MSNEESSEPGGQPPGPEMHIANRCSDPLQQGCTHMMLVPVGAYQSLKVLRGSVNAATWMLARMTQPTPAGPVPCILFVCPDCAAACAKAQAEVEAAAAAKASMRTDPPKPVDNTVPFPNIIGNRRPPR